MHRLRYLIGTLTLVAAVVGAWWMVRLLRNLDDRPGLALQIEFQQARGCRQGRRAAEPVGARMLP